ncbi:tyrosine-type recombinase/integrase [Clostridiaceae bacterium NSJ-31]|uniref:Tyrosine-type recombinase/integrase n=1 Tax=Ligaoa zhengdingensis TaxID=2763658 RepID=A0A926DYY0_9FIRM|nr:site-specific integrase [Ligaoa zhengdingensis]MBC8546493.1 tyrosine-type recombinase/integrase [Ligaoa zhengdingensis]
MKYPIKVYTMKCKKCKKDIPDESLYCMYCGAPQKRDKKKKLYQRPDGLYEKKITIDGRRVAFRGKSEAEIDKKILDYRQRKQEGPLFREVADEWEAIHFENLSPNSLKNYRPALNRARNAFGDRHITDIDAQEIKNYIKRFESEQHAKKTVKTQISIFSMIFTHAAVKGYVTHNPAEFIRPSNNVKPAEHREPPTEKEVQIINSSIGKTFGLFAFLILYTGCRRGEALALQYKDIDRNKNLVHITKSVFYVNNQPGIKTPKTTSSIRDVPLFSFLGEHIPPGSPNEYIFHNQRGELLKQHEFDKLWKTYQSESGLSLTPHQLRHGYATLLFENEISEKDAQELLGHSTLAMTQDVYTHIRKLRRAKTFAKLNLISINDPSQMP